MVEHNKEVLPERDAGVVADVAVERKGLDDDKVEGFRVDGPTDLSPRGGCACETRGPGQPFLFWGLLCLITMITIQNSRLNI